MELLLSPFQHRPPALGCTCGDEGENMASSIAWKTLDKALIQVWGRPRL